MKNLIKLAALAAVFGAPAFAEEKQAIVEIPSVLETSADLEVARLAILETATELCESVRYPGIQAFHKARLDRECVADAYADALAQEPTGKLLDYAQSNNDPFLTLAAR